MVCTRLHLCAEDDKKKEEKKASAVVVLKPLAWTLEVTAGSGSAAPLDAASTTRAIDLLLSAPHGVLRMSAEVKGKPDTSINLAFATLHATPQVNSRCLFCVASSCVQEMMLIIFLCCGVQKADAKDQKAAAEPADVLHLHFFARSSFDR